MEHVLNVFVFLQLLNKLLDRLTLFQSNLLQIVRDTYELTAQDLKTILLHSEVFCKFFRYILCTSHYNMPRFKCHQRLAKK